MRLRLAPRNRQFYVLFSEASSNVEQISDLFVELLDAYPEDGRDAIAKIKEREHEGDRLTTEVIGLVNRTFVTPFDRDDIFRLATALDDICDLIDEAALNLQLYDVKHIPERAQEQAKVIQQSAHSLDAGVRKLEDFKDVSEDLRALHELEDEGDRILRLSVAELFRSGQDPISIIRWKDIYEQLEEAIDAFEHAADVLEAIYVKNK